MFQQNKFRFCAPPPFVTRTNCCLPNCWIVIFHEEWGCLHFVARLPDIGRSDVVRLAPGMAQCACQKGHLYCRAQRGPDLLLISLHRLIEVLCELATVSVVSSLRQPTMCSPLAYMILGLRTSGGSKVISRVTQMSLECFPSMCRVVCMRAALQLAL